MALFLIAMPMIIPGVKLPVDRDDMHRVAQHLSSYHNGWNSTTADQIDAAYPTSEYATPAQRLVTAGTDFAFRCGTRTAVRALAASGVRVYLYSFEYHFTGYIAPTDAFCELDDELLCGDYHASELKFVWDK